MDTLPTSLTPALLRFCQTIAAERPLFVRSKPSRHAQLSYCFDNVARKIDRAGGSTAYGWAIWHFKGAYFEAEHHGVWCKRSGELVDVSPQFNAYSKILFLPDPSALYDPASFRPSRVAADGQDPRSIEVAQLMQERYAVLNACRERGAASPDRQSQLTADALLQRIAAFLRELR